jgi:hypothetical protein
MDNIGYSALLESDEVAQRLFSNDYDSGSEDSRDERRYKSELSQALSYKNDKNSAPSQDDSESTALDFDRVAEDEIERSIVNAISKSEGTDKMGTGKTAFSGLFKPFHITKASPLQLTTPNILSLDTLNFDEEAMKESYGLNIRVLKKWANYRNDVTNERESMKQELAVAKVKLFVRAIGE